MGLKEKINSSPRLKRISQWMISPKGQARPRLWIKWFVNPIIHQKARGSKICSTVRKDLFPFNNFNLGKGSTIEDFTVLNNGMGDIFVGENSRIGIGNTVIGPVTVGNNVIIGQNVVLSGMNHGYEDPAIPIKSQKCTYDMIYVGDDSWISANTIIVAGVTIGKHSIVAGGSVVIDDVPDHTIVGGNPAKTLKRYNFSTQQWEKVNS